MTESSRLLLYRGLLNIGIGAAGGWFFGKYVFGLSPKLSILFIVGFTLGVMTWATKTLWELKCRFYHLMEGLHAVVPDDDFFPPPPKPRLYKLWLKHFYRGPRP